MEGLEHHRRVVVRLPERLVDALDAYAGSGRKRSAVIRESLEFFLAERERQQVREQLIAGYQELGHLKSVLSSEEDWAL